MMSHWPDRLEMQRPPGRKTTGLSLQRPLAWYIEPGGLTAGRTNGTHTAQNENCWQMTEPFQFCQAFGIMNRVFLAWDHLTGERVPLK